MTIFNLRRSRRATAAGLGAGLALAVLVAAVVAGCGSSSKAAATAGGRSAQVLATVRRGDLTDSVTGRVQVTVTKSKTTVAAQVMGQNASQVAVGQPVTLAFFQRPSGTRQSQNSQGYGYGQGSQSSPSPNGQGYGYGQGSFGQGQGGPGFGGAFGGKTVQGTVGAVSTGSNGTTTVDITVAKLPSGITATSVGIAQIQVKVLATNVLILPTAAIKGSGSNATVQLLAQGTTSTRTIVVGQQSQSESEIVSGLNAGDNVVYTRTFSGQFPGFRNGQSGGQGFPQNGTSPTGVPSGT
jgi:hypothetical protein